MAVKAFGINSAIHQKVLDVSTPLYYECVTDVHPLEQGVDRGIQLSQTDATLPPRR